MGKAASPETPGGLSLRIGCLNQWQENPVQVSGAIYGRCEGNDFLNALLHLYCWKVQKNQVILLFQVSTWQGTALSYFWTFLISLELCKIVY